MHDEDLAARRGREAHLSGSTHAQRFSPRPVVAASWRRLRRLGLDPGSDPAVPPLGSEELERRRAHSGLAPLLPHIREALRPAVEGEGHLMVVADTDGRVLWREGQSPIRRHADRLGFVGGSAWTEGNVGTNAIGTSLALGSPTRIHGPEHYVESHTSWGCAAAPVHDPTTGRTLGVIDVSGPHAAMHPSMLTMVHLAARVAEMEVRQARLTAVERLRAHSLPLLERLRGPALVVDTHGQLVLASGVSAPDHLTLPSDMGVGEVWLPRLGTVEAETVPGGWLLRLVQEHEEPGGAAPVVVRLDLRLAQPRLTVSGEVASWAHDPTPRHTELLVALATHPDGRTAAELSQDLFDDPTRVVTVRAEMSRLRRSLGPVLRSQPYRFDPAVRVAMELPADPARVLPGSSAPVVQALRRRG